MNAKERAKRLYEDYPHTIHTVAGIIAGVALGLSLGTSKRSRELINADVIENVLTGETWLYVIHRDGECGRYPFRINQK